MLDLKSLLVAVLLTACVCGCARAPQLSVSELPGLTESQAEAFATLALACIDRPYPYKPGHVLTGPESVRQPRDYHPVFYGCFDWHSAVHGHWMLLRLLRRFPAHPMAGEIRRTLDQSLTAEAIQVEAVYFDDPNRKSFERPYGWAWLLRLAAELQTWQDPDGRRWADNLAPLEMVIVERLEGYLPKLDWPIRTGVHPNTAFALAQALDYAREVGNRPLEDLLVERSLVYYGDDRRCPADYEPSGEDFFSPCLLEADLMRRVLSSEDYGRWFDDFLPGLAKGQLGQLATPATVSDPSDPKIVHLDGLNLVRAWTLYGCASALPDTDPRRRVLLEAAGRHAEAGLARVTSGYYEGEHWLASFAVYLTTSRGHAGAGVIAPG